MNKKSLLVFVSVMIMLAGGVVISQTAPEPVKQLSSAQRDDAKKAVLCEEKALDAALAKVRKVGPLSKNAVDDFLKGFSYAYPPQKKGLVKRKLNLKLGQRNYSLSVPNGYAPDKSWPLIISMHGAGGNGDGEFNWMWAAHLSDWKGLIACPSGEPPTAQWGPGQEEFVLAVYKDVLADFNVNTNRVYVHGFSNGGNGAWYFAVAYPWLFGAACPRGGGCPLSQSLGNLLNLGVYIIHGSDDQVISCAHDHEVAGRLKELGYDYVYVEVPGGKHEPFQAETPKVIEYFNKHPRNPWPKTIKYAARSDQPEFVYWIEVTGADGAFRLEADVQAGNIIAVTTSNITGLTIRLSDALVDMNKPIQVLINEKEVHNAVVTRTLESLVIDLRQHRDANAASCAQLKFNIGE